MAAHRPQASLTGGVALLERAIGYTLGSLRLVDAELLARPTPCHAWDLRALLEHMDDSLAALCEAFDLGYIGLSIPPPSGDPALDLVAALRTRASQLLGAWTGADRDELVSVAGRPVTSSVLLYAGSIEIAVHGWDVAQACGDPRPIPAALAEHMLPLAVMFVTAADRPARFRAAIDVSPLATPGDRLVAFLGRLPHPDPL